MTDEYNAGLEAVAGTTDQFAHNFLKILAKETGGNLITSPLSAQVVLAMTAYGACGDTAEQMRSALLIPEDDKLGQSGYQSLVERFNVPIGVELRLANKIYTSILASVKPDYKELTAEKFLSSSEELDFNDSRGSAKIINTWCEEQTNERIKDLIAPDDLTPETMLVLVNAVYFKGRWETPFDESLTYDRPFHVNGESEINVPTMFLKTRLRFGEIPDVGACFVEIPYQGGEISMVILLPDKMTGLTVLEENLHKLNLSQSLQTSRCDDVQLFLPKFKIESTLDLKKTLENLGMTNIFENNADFSGISETPLKVSKVIQKAFIEVNEEGSEAAAATAVMLTLRCALPSFAEPVIFNVDRPFYYAIYHIDTKTPLFTGFVRRPEVA